MAIKKLTDIPITELEVLQKLCQLAPKEQPKKAPYHTRQPENVQPGRSDGAKKSQELGKVDIPAYLGHYGVEYNIKTTVTKSGPADLYRLQRCLFDPNHGKNEAAIVQDSFGKITYQCFHDTCNHTWQEARAHISGDELLTEFREGYDPNWKPPEKRKRKTTPDKEKSWLSWSDKDRAVITAKRLADTVREHYEPVMHDEILDHFFIYKESGIWEHITNGEIERYIIQDQLQDLAKAHTIKETMTLLKRMVLVTQKETFENAYLLNLKNGMLDINTMELHPHSPEYHSRVQMPVSYDEDANCPLWLKTLDEIFCDDTSKVAVLHQFFGYCLYPRILFPCALFQIGGGGNGKGVVEEILSTMLGDENVSHISMERMQKPFGPIEIKDKLLNSCGETESAPLDVTNFKALAAGDKVQAEVKYRGDVKFRPIAKHMISMNHFPGLKEKTKAFFRRVIVLEYNQTFEGDDEDTSLGDKLLEEIDGIFMWALEALPIVIEQKRITTTQSVDLAKERFREHTNPVLLFIKEALVIGEQYYAARADFWRVYKNWHAESGAAKKYMLKKNNFYEQLRLNLVLKLHRMGTKDCLVGAGIRTDTEWNTCSLPEEPPEQ